MTITAGWPITETGRYLSTRVDSVLGQLPHG